MYSYGSSARAGVGKRGHGGRKYRPPKPRRDVNATPPPLKQCSCLLQMDIPEYQHTAPRRLHTTFGGREAVRTLEQQLRTLFCVHFIVPGRQQSGPVAIAGATYRQAIPAAEYLLARVQMEERLVPGRIQRNVKDESDATFAGNWLLSPTSTDVRTRWVFQSTTWNVLSCPVSFDDSSGSVEEENDNSSSLSSVASSNNSHRPERPPSIENLQVCVDNLRFRLGTLEGLDMFYHYAPPLAFGAGNPTVITALFDQVQNIL